MHDDRGSPQRPQPGLAPPVLDSQPVGAVRQQHPAAQGSRASRRVQEEEGQGAPRRRQAAPDYKGMS